MVTVGGARKLTPAPRAATDDMTDVGGCGCGCGAARYEHARPVASVAADHHTQPSITAAYAYIATGMFMVSVILASSAI